MFHLPVRPYHKRRLRCLCRSFTVRAILAWSSLQAAIVLLLKSSINDILHVKLGQADDSNYTTSTMYCTDAERSMRTLAQHEKLSSIKVDRVSWPLLSSRISLSLSDHYLPLLDMLLLFMKSGC